MSQFKCPRSGQECPTYNICKLPNAPLVDSIKRIFEAVDRHFPYKYIEGALVKHIDNLGGQMHVELNPKGRGNSIVVCGKDIVDGKAVVKKDPAIVAGGIAQLLRVNTIPDLIGELKVQHQKRQRRDKI